MVKRINAYEACGQTFATKKEAARHEANERLTELVLTAPGDQVNAVFLREWMLKEGWRLVNILSDVLRRGVDTPTPEF